MRARYWSCTKFADWLRGTNKLDAGTSREWAQWTLQAERKHPIRYWIAEEGLDHIQTIIMFIPDKIYSVKYSLANRFVTRTHTLTSKLKKYKWHELDTRILNCLFDELVNFVEVELAVANFRFDDEARKKYKVPFWGSGWFRSRTYRNKEAGLDYLNWAINLKMDENWGMSPEDDGYGKPSAQAEAAKEILELYTWWTEVYPNRPDPYDISGWSKLCERRREEGGGFLSIEDTTPEQKEETTKSLNVIREVEEKYDREEEEMLIRLIKVRKHLWT